MHTRDWSASDALCWLIHKDCRQGRCPNSVVNDNLSEDFTRADRRCFAEFCGQNTIKQDLLCIDNHDDYRVQLYMYTIVCTVGILVYDVEIDEIPIRNLRYWLHRQVYHNIHLNKYICSLNFLIF